MNSRKKIATKLQALRVVVYECQTNRTSDTALLRLRKAMNVLGLSLEEKREFEGDMEYRGMNGDLLPIWAHLEYPEFSRDRT